MGAAPAVITASFPRSSSRPLGQSTSANSSAFLFISEPVAVGWVVLLNSIPTLSENFEYYAWVIGCCSGLSLILTLTIDVSKVDRKAFLKKVDLNPKCTDGAEL